MRGAADYAVVYDISCDRERARVDRLLRGYGFRVQKSVFECRLTRRQRDELVRRLERLGLRTGFVKVYRLDYCSDRPVVGRPPGDAGPDADSAFVV